MSELGLWLSLGGIILLLLLSALFAMSLTGLTDSSEARISYLAGQGSRNARRVQKLLARRDRLISALLFGNDTIKILASALATGVMISFFGLPGLAYAVVAIAFLVLVFSEAMPRAYAINRPERVAIHTAPFTYRFVRLVAPLVEGVQILCLHLLRLFGLRLVRDSSVTASEEMRSTLQLHAETGAMVKHERDMLGSILDLDEVPVGDVMAHRRNMEMLDADLPPDEFVRQVLASSHTRIPVWRKEPENVVGVLHAKDLLRALAANDFKAEKLNLNQLLQPPWFVPDTTTLREQLNAFRQRRAHFALVVDEYGVIMGLVTLEDILEEIVGDIRDEHDPAQRGLRLQPDGSLLVDGTTTIRDLNRQFDWHLPDDDATTIAGLVLHEAQAIPEPGQVFVFHDFRFEVLRRQGNRITHLRMTPPAERQDKADRAD